MAMSTSANNQSANIRAGLKNTLRFKWKSQNQILDRVSFGREILFDILKMRPDDIYCLQQNKTEGFYDVSFLSNSKMQEAHDMANQEATSSLKNFELFSLARNNNCIITVHMYNPWVSEEAVRYFLNRFMTVLPGVNEIKDALGIWTGKRQFQVQLREDRNGCEGYLHPPASFTKLSNHWPHNERLKRCSLCNSHTHLAKDCPKLSYPGAIKGNMVPLREGHALRDIEEVIWEIEAEREAATACPAEATTDGEQRRERTERPGTTATEFPHSSDDGGGDWTVQSDKRRHRQKQKKNESPKTTPEHDNQGWTREQRGLRKQAKAEITGGTERRTITTEMLTRGGTYSRRHQRRYAGRCHHRNVGGDRAFVRRRNPHISEHTCCRKT
ncbi:hypothetical protein ABVT39_026944 [Epinephelus coioides]